MDLRVALVLIIHIMQTFSGYAHSMRKFYSSSALSLSQNADLSSKWEFGSFPVNLPPVNIKEELLAKMISEEEERKRSNETALSCLTAEEIKEGIAHLSPHCKPERLIKFQQVLGKRTKHARIVFENPSNANNAWAV